MVEVFCSRIMDGGGERNGKWVDIDYVVCCLAVAGHAADEKQRVEAGEAGRFGKDWLGPHLPLLVVDNARSAGMWVSASMRKTVDFERKKRGFLTAGCQLNFSN